MSLDVGLAARDFLGCLGRSKTEEELLAELAGDACRIVGADACDILLRSGDALVMRASTNSPEFVGRVRLGRGIGLSGAALQSNEAIFIKEEASKDPRYVQFEGLGDHDANASAAIPLRISAGPPIGVLLLSKTEKWTLRARERASMLQLGELVAHTVLAFRNAYKSGARSSRLGAVSEVTRTLSSSPYLEEILQLLVNLTAQQFNYQVCTVRLLDESRSELVLRATQAPAKAYQRKRAIKLGESIAGKAIGELRPIVVADVQLEEDYIGHDLAAEQGLRSMICVPLTIQDRAVGVMSCYTADVRDFAAEEIEALEMLAKQAAVSIEHAKLQVRNTLMQEMHHRVKNNLQQIASLIRLQMRRPGKKPLAEALSDTLTRILAISSVHDLLSRDDLDHVDVRSIGEALVHHQQSSLILPDRTIGFRVTGHDVFLNTQQATQVALILNELIANAVEHGFRTTKHGEIHVNVEEKDGEVAVWVSNNGDAVPSDFELEHAAHLGLQIVDNLARGLGGKFLIENRFGWTVSEVKFPRASAE